MNVQVSGQPASLTQGYCIVAAQPKRRLLPKTTRWVSPQGLAPRFPLPCWGHTYAFDCYLLVSATTYCVFANSCHTIMYYSVFRFVYAHFIVAIIDSCCMDEKKNLNKTIFDLLMQQLCGHCVPTCSTRDIYSRCWDVYCFKDAGTLMEGVMFWFCRCVIGKNIHHNGYLPTYIYIYGNTIFMT